MDAKYIDSAVESAEKSKGERKPKPNVSIIIAVYNVGEFIERCIRSVLGQKLHDIEVIVVDDGSKDDSGKICDCLAEEDRRVKVIHTSNEGLASARRRGVREAEADWIGFIDGDDWIESTMYELLYYKAVNLCVDVIAQGYVEDVDGTCTDCLNNMDCGLYSSKDDKCDFLRNMICCDDFFRMGIQPYIWNKLFKKDLLWSHVQDLDLNIQIGEDAAIVFPTLMKAERIAVTSDCCYHYCLRSNSMMHRERDARTEYDNALRLHRFLKGSFIRYGYYEAVRDSLNKYTIHNLLTRAISRIVGEIDIPEGSGIVIYGAGAFGKSLYRYLESQGRYHIRLWVDKRAKQLMQMGFPVSQLEEMDREEEALILIALLSEKAVEEARKELGQAGLKEERLVWAMDVLHLVEVKL